MDYPDEFCTSGALHRPVQGGVDVRNESWDAQILTLIEILNVII